MIAAGEFPRKGLDPILLFSKKLLALVENLDSRVNDIRGSGLDLERDPSIRAQCRQLALLKERSIETLGLEFAIGSNEFEALCSEKFSHISNALDTIKRIAWDHDQQKLSVLAQQVQHDACPMSNHLNGSIPQKTDV